MGQQHEFKTRGGMSGVPPAAEAGGRCQPKPGPGQERTKQRSRKLGDPVPMQPLER